MNWIKTNGDRLLYLFGFLGLLGLFWFYGKYLPEYESKSVTQPIQVNIEKRAYVKLQPTLLKEAKNIKILEELTSRQMSDYELVQKAIDEATKIRLEKGWFHCVP